MSRLEEVGIIIRKCHRNLRWVLQLQLHRGRGRKLQACHLFVFWISNKCDVWVQESKKKGHCWSVKNPSITSMNQNSIGIVFWLWHGHGSWNNNDINNNNKIITDGIASRSNNSNKNHQTTSVIDVPDGSVGPFTAIRPGKSFPECCKAFPLERVGACRHDTVGRSLDSRFDQLDGVCKVHGKDSRRTAQDSRL